MKLECLFFFTFSSHIFEFGLCQIRHRCYECSSIPNPRDCNKVTVCEVGERCFIQQYVTESANIKYDLGCMPVQRCKARSVGRRRNDEPVTTCTSCCNGEFCNNEGCGVKFPPKSQRGPLCFNCQQMDDPKLCRTTTLCSNGQGCQVHSERIGQSIVYTSGCVSNLQCNPVINASLTNHQDCPWCCLGDSCHDHCIHQCNPVINASLTNHQDCPWCCLGDYCNDHCRDV